MSPGRARSGASMSLLVTLFALLSLVHILFVDTCFAIIVAVYLQPTWWETVGPYAIETWG